VNISNIFFMSVPHIYVVSELYVVSVKRASECGGVPYPVALPRRLVSCQCQGGEGPPPLCMDPTLKVSPKYIECFDAQKNPL